MVFMGKLETQEMILEVPHLEEDRWDFRSFVCVQEAPWKAEVQPDVNRYKTVLQF